MRLYSQKPPLYSLDGKATKPTRDVTKKKEGKNERKKQTDRQSLLLSTVN